MPLRKKIRYMLPEEKDTLMSWRKMDKEVSEFVFCWSRWKKWESEPPIVAVVDYAPVGYHGVSYTPGYVNSISQFVLQEFRGFGLATAMIGHLLSEANTRGISRLRFRTPEFGDGYECWKGLGALPFGSAKGDYWYDLLIEGVSDVAEFVSRKATLHLLPTSDRRRLSYYKRSGVIPLIDEYRGLL